METIDFNEVIKDPETISVVGELLGVPNVIYAPLLTILSKTVQEAKDEIYQCYLNYKKPPYMVRIPILGYLDLVEHWTDNDYIISRSIFGEAIFESSYNKTHAGITFKSYSLDAYRTYLTASGISDNIKKY